MAGGVDVHCGEVREARRAAARLEKSQMRAAATAPHVVRQRVFTSLRPMRATPHKAGEEQDARDVAAGVLLRGTEQACRAKSHRRHRRSRRGPSSR